MKKYIKNITQFINEKTAILNDNFWKWFGKSKMIENDEPIIFYHGSNANRMFSTFNDDTPIWFTKYEGYANAFISNNGKIFRVYLKLENPLYIGDIDSITNVKTLSKLSELTTIDIDILKDILRESNGVNIFKITNSIRFKNLVEDMGFDGLESREGGLSTYAVFNPNQIKSIKNNGDYSLLNNNINK